LWPCWIPVSAPVSDMAVVVAPQRRFLPARLLGGEWTRPVGVLLVLALVVFAVGGDALAPYSPFKMALRLRFADPSWAHWLGTDQLGRDILSRVIVGARFALFLGLSATGLSIVGGVMLGLLAGYGPRWLDALLLVLFDTTYSFPVVMLALAVITLLGPDLDTVLLIVVIVTIPRYARLIRTSTQSLRQAEFILAERSLGAGPARILLRHVLPNVIGPLLILASMDIPGVITLEAGLSFLGLGVPPPAPSWGRMLSEGYNYIRDTPWIVVGGSLPLILTTLGFTFLGESLRDALDPRLRRNR
jgi:peptide/nickel transport system permease protein